MWGLGCHAHAGTCCVPAVQPPHRATAAYLRKLWQRPSSAGDRRRLRPLTQQSAAAAWSRKSCCCHGPRASEIYSGVDLFEASIKFRNDSRGHSTGRLPRLSATGQFQRVRRYLRVAVVLERGVVRPRRRRWIESPSEACEGSVAKPHSLACTVRAIEEAAAFTSVVAVRETP